MSKSQQPDPKHLKRINDELLNLGVSWYGKRKFESRYLANVIQEDEKIGGIIYGFYDNVSKMIIATDKRVIILNKKPLFVDKDEVFYSLVGGVSHSRAGITSTVTLHTRIKDFKLITFNKKCADGFVKFIEKKCLQDPASGRLF